MLNFQNNKSNEAHFGWAMITAGQILSSLTHVDKNVTAIDKFVHFVHVQNEINQCNSDKQCCRYHVIGLSVFRKCFGITENEHTYK